MTSQAGKTESNSTQGPSSTASGIATIGAASPKADAAPAVATAVAGIHHITTFAGDPNRNLGFYVRTLGLRLVKQTVNFDDPSTYHLYFGDEVGSPGSILTFFPITHAARGRRGSGEVVSTNFSVPVGSLERWQAKLRAAGVELPADGRVFDRFGQRALALRDADGTDLLLVEDASAVTNGPDAIRGFAGATLRVPASARTTELLTGVLGYRIVGTDANVTRLVAAGDAAAIGTSLDLQIDPAGSARERPTVGAGSVHHIALRARDDAHQSAIAEAVRRFGLLPTEQRDRSYFRSIYFRDTSGILFEVATDEPGFATDETTQTLGQTLKLPAWLESHRRQIESSLPKLGLPDGGAR